MGYYFSMHGESFKIPSQNVNKAHRALLLYMKNNHYFTSSEGTLEQICNDSFEECMFHLGYGIGKSLDGGYNDIWLEHDRFWDEKEIFNELAPFVEDGSYLEFDGEDGTLWRYAFKNGECIEQYPKIEWV